jgi:hypothetical protein
MFTVIDDEVGELFNWIIILYIHCDVPIVIVTTLRRFSPL